MFGLGMGSVFVPIILTTVSGVAAHETGSASGLLNTTQQVGGALGLSILVTVFGTANRNAGKQQAAQSLAHATPKQAAAFSRTHQLPAPCAGQVLAHSIATAFQMGLVFALLAAVLALFAIKAGRPVPGGEPAAQDVQPMVA